MEIEHIDKSFSTSWLYFLWLL